MSEDNLHVMCANCLRHLSGPIASGWLRWGECVDGEGCKQPILSRWQQFCNWFKKNREAPDE